MAIIHHAIQFPACLLSASGFHNSQFPSNLPPKFTRTFFKTTKAKQLKCKSLYADDDDGGYLVDAPVQEGDGFSFYGGNYSDMPSRAEEWLKQGKFIKTTSIHGAMEKAKDPIFGLAMGKGSQVEEDGFRWFYVEAGNTSNHSVVLVHGLPSQAYSFRKVLSVLSQDYHVIAFDWLGFGFSDKPQPSYGFDYTIKEYKASFESLLDVLSISKFTVVSQGYFTPIIAAYAKSHQENLRNLVLINPPLTEQHAKLPSILSSFSSFLLGEIFSQDPLRASDRLLTSCGPYLMDEEDAMVYRRPYLTSGSSGFVKLCSEVWGSNRMARWLPILALRVGPATAKWLASVTGFLLAVAMVAVVTASCTARFHRNNKNYVIRGFKSARKFPGRALINSSKKLLISRKWGAKEDEEEAYDRAVIEEEEEGGEDFVWQRSILMGERCEPLNFSGLIIYDDKGNRLPQFPPRSPKPNIFQLS